MKFTALVLAIALPSFAIETRVREGDVQATPALTDAEGRPLADSKYIQRVVGNVVHVEAIYDFPDGRRATEKASLKLKPKLEQLSWEYLERRGSETIRHYAVDLRTRKAVAEKPLEGKHWEETVDVEPGETFAGIGMVYAVKSLRPRIPAGSEVRLHAIAFTPKPRSVGVAIQHDGPDSVRMAGREILSDRFTVHPLVPAIAKLFVKAPDQHIWLYRGEPAAFLRFEGTSVEPTDPVVHVDLVPGAPVSRAEARTSRAEARTPKPARAVRK